MLPFSSLPKSLRTIIIDSTSCTHTHTHISEGFPKLITYSTNAFNQMSSVYESHKPLWISHIHSWGCTHFWVPFMNMSLVHVEFYYSPIIIMVQLSIKKRDIHFVTGMNLSNIRWSKCLYGNRFWQDPRKSAQQLARALNLNHVTEWQILKDQQLHPLYVQCVPDYLEIYLYELIFAIDNVRK